MAEQPFNPVEWITTSEASELTGYHRNAFINATRRGALESIKRGHTMFFRKQDVLAYISRMNKLGTKKFTPKKYRKKGMIQKSDDTFTLNEAKVSL